MGRAYGQKTRRFAIWVAAHRVGEWEIGALNGMVNGPKNDAPGAIDRDRRCLPPNSQM